MPGTVQKKQEEYRMRKSGGLAKMRDVRDLAVFLGKKLGFKVSTDGMQVQEIADGFHLKAEGGRQDDYAFKLRVGSDGEILYVTDRKSVV